MASASLESQVSHAAPQFTEKLDLAEHQRDAS